ncbi:hypothetical protein [Paenibacillus sp. CF384]|uniref:hypothetical protein n=1 Tax=Paenibacillus sp. CF384 TaxID=1884382 RepID=UPI000895812D|nr:hypothetical protein [Paenibacillus sp. CF384]SDW67624.1 hypothetical protein SAMN05518855_1004100 [Paenibacillus sp. CF384]
MPFIQNFPSALLQEHVQWHHANHHDDPSQLPAGYGAKFMQFHRYFINKALQWYYQQGYDPQLVAPWQSVPEAIRNTSCYNRNAEARLMNNLQSFSTLDQLGLFIEGSNLHGCIHQEASRIFGENFLNDFDLAPQSTYFYQIHGMLDQWYKRWEQLAGQNGFVGGGRGASQTRKSASTGNRGQVSSAVSSSRRGKKKAQFRPTAHKWSSKARNTPE